MDFKMPEIDEGLYSRQLYVLGKHAMHKLSGGNVLICGQGGLGLEVAKNLALAGVGKMTTHDSKELKWKDLSSHFFAQESDIGKNRALVSKQKLSELNPYVSISVMDGNLTEECIQSFETVVLTDSSTEECTRLGNICHNCGVHLVVANTKGLFGQLFCDFGASFTIIDKFASAPSQSEILHIAMKDDRLEVYLTDESHDLFSEGDHVTFHGVEGKLAMINDYQDTMEVVESKSVKYFEVKIPSPLQSSLQTLLNDGSTLNGQKGYVKEIRQKETMNFKSFEESLTSPEYVISDWGKQNDRLLIHKAFVVLDDFRARHNRLPKPKSKQDALEFIEMYRNKVFCSDDQELNKMENLGTLLSKFAMTCDGDFAPVQSIIGSLAAQEVVKAITGKFQPLDQWFQFDARELLNDEWEELSEADCQPKGSRYDGVTNVLGHKFHSRLMDSNLFMVGVGAIGCEMLKNWAMLGIGSGQGRVTITDMDMIEKSNLNRQFLFRAEHIGKMKSTTAADVIKRQMNKDMNVESHVNKVAKETENVYSDGFFQKLDVVVSSLDNVEARNYLDERCISNEKPLIDSGTMGLECSVQVILPHLTVTYKTDQGQGEGQRTIPMCTLRSFPSIIEHTIEWARDKFEGTFNISIKSAIEYIEDERFLGNLDLLNPYQKKEKLENVKTVFVDILNRSPEPRRENLVRWARLSFDQMFDHQIRQLLSAFPSDHIKDGTPFWSGSKKCPEYSPFDANNTLHMDYIISTTNILAQIFNLPLFTDDDEGRNEAREILKSLQVPEFKMDKNAKIATNDEELKSQMEATEIDDDEYKEILDQLPTRETVRNLRMNAVEFEKDSSDNFHVDYITAASNLRATNYRIPNLDKFETKGIVGRIIPAVATTTSFVVGLVCVELIKILAGNWKLENFKNAYNKLAQCMFNTTKLRKAAVRKYNDEEFTLWSRFNVDDITIGKLVEYLKEKHQLTVDHIVYGTGTLLLSGETKNVDERKSKKISQAIEELTKKPLEPNVTYIQLQICGYDRDGNDIDILPFVRVKLL